MMSLQRGFAAVKKAKKEADTNREQMEAMRTRDLVLLNDGDEAELWFIGTADVEPGLVFIHNLKGVGGQRFRTDICAADFEGHDGCVECWAANSGDKRVSKRRKAGVFSVVDTRWVHKRKNDEKTAAAGGRFEKFDWFTCTEDSDEGCKYCKKKIPRERRGLVKGRFGVQVLSTIDGINDTLSRKCLNCSGKIKRVGYTKEITLESGKTKTKRVDDIEDVDNPEEWTAEYECSKCDEPSPGNIFSCPISYRRNGKGESTTYSVTPVLPFESPPDWVMELEPLDLEKVLVPRSAERQAELLAISNPFSKAGKKSNGKATDFNDSDNDPFDDDDEKEKE